MWESPLAQTQFRFANQSLVGVALGVFVVNTGPLHCYRVAGLA